MQLENLVWLVAGIGVGLFIAMAMLALFAAGERRHMRRWRRMPAAAPAPARLSEATRPEPEPTNLKEVWTSPGPVVAEPSIKRSTPAIPQRETRQAAAPIPAERPQVDIETLFEEAFQSSLKPGAQAAEPPKQQNS